MEQKNVVIIEAEEYRDGHFREKSRSDIDPEEKFFNNWDMSDITKCDCLATVLFIMTTTIVLAWVAKFIFAKHLDESSMSIWRSILRWGAVLFSSKILKTWLALRPHFMRERPRWTHKLNIGIAAAASIMVVIWRVQIVLVERQTSMMFSIFGILQFLSVVCLIGFVVKNMVRTVIRCLEEDRMDELQGLLNKYGVQ